MAKVTSTTQNLTYLGYLQQSPQDRLQEELQSQVQEVKSSWEVNISKTKASLARAKKNLQDSYRTASIDGIIGATEQVEGFTRGLEIMEAAFAQLFPAETV